jgi:type I restriction-modification system DNA methylase subunit
VFKNELWQDLVKNNAKHDKLLLYKKSQKLLDRFLFILFSEDKGLLPPNSIVEIVKQWEKLKDMDEYRPLYDRFKKYFNYMNEGHKGKEHEIFAYNGGLFLPDELLDAIVISDVVLNKHIVKLAGYDFASEVDVNILGHIFEHSLAEIEAVTAELEGKEIDKSKTKRKKDGIFYTPKYITKYIVENTVGKLCTEKKTELEIIEDEFTKERKNRKKETLKKLDSKLKQYREWLLQITICDPACGSGAFLNQALDFLIKEHTYIDELQAKLLGSSFVFPDVENHILENNLYGVDINEESIEIARLSLWLRTAHKGRKLTTLSSNIKCGNSLIDDVTIAGEKAFDWKTIFPEVFAKGGFDVVIGNPPYVRQELVKEFSNYLSENYKVFSGKADLYTFFYERAIDITKTKGIIAFISSGKFFEASYGKPLTAFLSKNVKFEVVINFDDLEVFEGISAYPLIFIGHKINYDADYKFKYCFVPSIEFNSLSEVINILPMQEIFISDFIENDYQFYSREVAKLFKTTKKNSYYLNDLQCLPLVGIKTGYNEGFICKVVKNDFVKPYIFGKDIKKYNTPESENEIVFPYTKKNDEYVLLKEEELGKLKIILETEKEKLQSRAIIKDGVKNGTKTWYEYQQINKKLDFEKEYIVYPNVSLGTNFTLSKGNIIDMTGFIIPSNDKFLLALLNSKLTEYLMRRTAITRRGGYQEYKVQYLEKIPIKKVDARTKQMFSVKVDSIMQRTSTLQNIQGQFINLLKSKSSLEKLSNKLLEWHDLEFKDFLSELKKVKIKLSLADEAEWMKYFNEQKQKAHALKKEIEDTDNEINLMVYKLYDLSPEEIKIVEEG